MTEVTMAQLGMTEVTDGGPHGGTVQPKTFNIGDRTMALVFNQLSITDVSDQHMQAIWDQIERVVTKLEAAVPEQDERKAVFMAGMFAGNGLEDTVCCLQPELPENVRIRENSWLDYLKYGSDEELIRGK